MSTRAGKPIRKCIDVFGSNCRQSAGFTLIEMIVVLAVAGSLIALTTTNLMGLRNSTDTAVSVDMVVADFSAARQRSMIGDTQGRSDHDAYGIHFETTGYTLFHGTTYSASASSNIVIPFEGSLNLQSTTFPNSAIVFAKGSGEVIGYSPTANSVTFVNTADNVVRTIIVNSYGTILSGLN